MHVLEKYHQRLRTGLLVNKFLPALRPLLTRVEYSSIRDKEGNVAQVDELIDIMLTKEDGRFVDFCTVLEENGYEHWARTLQEEVDDKEGKLICLHVPWSCRVLGFHLSNNGVAT